MNVPDHDRALIASSRHLDGRAERGVRERVSKRLRKFGTFVILASVSWLHVPASLTNYGRRSWSFLVSEIRSWTITDVRNTEREGNPRLIATRPSRLTAIRNPPSCDACDWRVSRRRTNHVAATRSRVFRFAPLRFSREMKISFNFQTRDKRQKGEWMWKMQKTKVI